MRAIYLLAPGLMVLSGCQADSSASEEPEHEAVSEMAESQGLSLGDAVEAAGLDAQRYRRQRLVPIGHRYALVSEYDFGESDYGHATAGRLDITYLDSDGASFAGAEHFANAVQVGSSGRMAEWAIVDRFTSNPVIYASGGFTGQGVTEGCTVLTELTAGGPREIAVIPDYYGGTSFDGAEFETEGKIENIRKGASFDVSYVGSDRGVVRYRFQNGAFHRVGKAVLDHCGE